MRELFKQLPRAPLGETSPLVLLDSCFIIWMLEQQQERELLSHDAAILSFTAEELSYVEQHRIHDKSKVRLRHLLKHDHHLKIVDVPVHPGNNASEKEFVRSIDPVLLEKIADPSDAVLVAAAIRTHAHVITRDKHHLYTAKLGNYLERYGIKVLNHFDKK